MKFREIGKLAGERDEQRLSYKELQKFQRYARCDPTADEPRPVGRQSKSQFAPLDAAQPQRAAAESQEIGCLTENDQMILVGDENSGNGCQFENDENLARAKGLAPGRKSSRY